MWLVVRLQAAARLTVSAPQWDLLPWAISHPDTHGVCVTLWLWHACFHRLPTSSAVFLTCSGRSDTRPANRNRRLSITDEKRPFSRVLWRTEVWTGTPLGDGSGWLKVWNVMFDSICDHLRVCLCMCVCEQRPSCLGQSPETTLPSQVVLQRGDTENTASSVAGFKIKLRVSERPT